MIVHMRIVFLVATFWARRVTAFPHAQLQASSQLPSAALLSRLLPEAPSASNLSAPTYLCYEPGASRVPINVDDCRATLKIIREMPDYRKVQEFQTDVRPKIASESARPSTPPFLIVAEDTVCALEIAAVFPGIADKFSFEQVRNLATNIIEDCSSSSWGYGGQWEIGARGQWRVRVFGVKEDLLIGSLNPLGAAVNDTGPVINSSIILGSSENANSTLITNRIPILIPAQTS